MTNAPTVTPPKAAPDLQIPTSDHIATVRAIDTTSTIHFPPAFFFETPISSHKDLNAPAYSFLITSSTGRHVLFDLGVRKDHENLPPSQLHGLKRVGGWLDVKKDIVDILDHDGDSSTPKARDIEALIWSHHHFDHTGNPSRFPKSIPLVVGPDFREKMLPGYPADPNSRVPSEYWQDRELRQIDFAQSFKVGRFDAIDYFGDGTFYLLNSPGHAVGHMCGLARVGADAFVLMGGDACHHGGEFRPTAYLPLPSSAQLPSSKRFSRGGCPGEILEKLQPDRRADQPYYQPTKSFPDNWDDCMASVSKLEEFDAQENVLCVIAHDATLRDQLPLFPQKLNAWREGDLKQRTRWSFLDDFAGSLDEIDA